MVRFARQHLISRDINTPTPFSGLPLRGVGVFTPQERRRIRRLANRIRAIIEELEELDADIEARRLRLTHKQRIELAQSVLPKQPYVPTLRRKPLSF